MTLLFLKRSINYLLALLFSFISYGAIVKDSLPDNDFGDYCAKSDAYFLFSYTDVTYTLNFGSYKRYVTVSNKLVINNGAGVDKYAYLNLPDYITNNIKEIDVKTLKADGTVVELDSSKVFVRKPDERKFGAVNYPIPSVEPGDTIETSYTYTKYVKLSEMTSFVDLYASLPSFTTEYSIKSHPKLSIRYKGYNGFPKPQVVANDSLIYSVFKMDKIKELKQNRNTCLRCELPYMYYSMEEKDTELSKWEDVYNLEFNAITQPIAIDNQNSSYYNRWKKRIIDKAKDSSKYHKLKLLHANIMKDIHIESLDVKEILKSNGFFLKEKRFNQFSIRRLYRQILEDLEIDYWAVFARSRSSGKIDPYYIRSGEYDHIFFAYTNEKGKLDLLYPHETVSKYEMNEIPTSIFNTQAVIAKPYRVKKMRNKDKFIGLDMKLAEVDSVTVNIIELPGTSAHNNYVKQILYSDVNTKEKKIPLKYKFSISGGLYTDLKSFYGLLTEDSSVSTYYEALSEIEEEEVIAIDTILEKHLKEKKPFVQTIIAEGSLNGAMTFLNDNLVSISLEKLLNHNQVESEYETIDMNYYLDYNYQDYIMSIFNFPNEIEILDENRYHTITETDVGEYSFEVKRVNGNQITIQSNYIINTDIIPKESYAQLKRLNEKLKEFKKKRILLKLKKS